MIVEGTESKTKELYRNYDLVVTGKTAVYRYICFNEPDKDVITHFIITGEGGEIIIDFPCGNNFIFRDNFDRTIDDFLFWVKHEQPDRYGIEDRVYKSLVQSDSLFNHRIEQAKKKERADATRLEYIAESEVLTEKVKNATKRTKFYFYWNVSGFYLLDFPDESNKNAFDSATDQRKRDFIEYKECNPGFAGMEIVYSHDLNSGYYNGKVYHSKQDLQKILEDLERFTD